MEKEENNKTETVDYLYKKYKSLQKELELLEIQENYNKEEIQNLKIKYPRVKEEIKIIQGTPLIIGQFSKMIDENFILSSWTRGDQHCVRVLNTINKESLKTLASVPLHKNTHSVVDVLPPEANSIIQMSKITEKPDVACQDIDTLVPVLLRHGWLNRKIEFSFPDRRQKRLIYQVITGKMNLSEEVDLEKFINKPKKVSAANTVSICQEAGLLAIRINSYAFIFSYYYIK